MSDKAITSRTRLRSHSASAAAPGGHRARTDRRLIALLATLAMAVPFTLAASGAPASASSFTVSAKPSRHPAIPTRAGTGRAHRPQHRFRLHHARPACHTQGRIPGRAATPNHQARRSCGGHRLREDQLSCATTPRSPTW
jgi:hypothetical protein